MATPLFWEAWKLSNSVYDVALKYPFTMKMIPETNRFVLENRKSKQIPLCIALSIIFLYLLFYIYLILQAVFLSTKLMDKPTLLINTALAGMLALCLLLALIIQSCAHTVAVQHLNALIQYEKRLLKMSTNHQRFDNVSSLWILINQGKYITI